MASSSWSPRCLAAFALTILTCLSLVDARPPYADPRRPATAITSPYRPPGSSLIPQSNSSTPVDPNSVLAAVRYKGPEKYFREAAWSTHYDARFAKRTLRAEEKRLHLIALVQTYLTTMNALGVETWIMHGSLLGWWWNQKIMPFDDDVDVMTSLPSTNFLAEYYNMTVHRYQLAYDPNDPSTFTSPPQDYLGPAREYLLDINPHYSNGSITDRYNVIDARWIDVATGLYIDITTLRTNETAVAAGRPGAMMVKDKHTYEADDIYPLRDSLFEGTPCKVPFEYANMLTDEYGAQSLTLRNMAGYHFDGELAEWVPMKTTTRPLRVGDPITPEQSDAARMLAAVATMVGTTATATTTAIPTTMARATATAPPAIYTTASGSVAPTAAVEAGVWLAIASAA